VAGDSWGVVYAVGVVG